MNTAIAMPIDTNARAARVIQLDPDNAAVGWMFRHGHRLDRVTAIEELTLFLMSEYAMTERAAEIAALQAYAETSSVSQLASIDIDASTAHLVVLRTAGGRAVAFTVDDLMRTLEQARADGHARVVNNDTRTPVVLNQ